MGRLIVEQDTVYEIDEGCLRRRKAQAQFSEKQNSREEQQEKESGRQPGEAPDREEEHV